MLKFLSNVGVAICLSSCFALCAVMLVITSIMISNEVSDKRNSVLSDCRIHHLTIKDCDESSCLLLNVSTSLCGQTLYTHILLEGGSNITEIMEKYPAGSIYQCFVVPSKCKLLPVTSRDDIADRVAPQIVFICIPVVFFGLVSIASWISFISSLRNEETRPLL